MSKFRMVRRLAGCAGMFLLVILGTAQAASSIDVATLASAVNQEQCANVHNISKQQVSALGMQKVVEVWAEVGRIYEEQGRAPYLLFWRGVLAQCLGRNELAVLDLESFIASQNGQSMFVDLVRQSKSRLKRLGRGGKVGEGPSAVWLRKPDIVELGVSYGVATGVRGMGCTDSGGEDDAGRDPNTVARVSNSTCAGGSAVQTTTGDALLLPSRGLAPPFWPVGLRFDAAIYPVPALGFGVVLQLDGLLPTAVMEAHPLGPVTQLFVGPQVRIMSGVSSGRRAAELRIAPRFAVAWGQAIPWAGQKIPSVNGFLDAGMLSTRHLGIQLEVAGRFEVAPKAVLKVSGEFVYYFDGAPDSVSTVAPSSMQSLTWLVGGVPIDVEEQVEKFPPLLRTSRVYVAGRVALLRPLKVHNLALGPFFEVAFHRTQLHYPNLVSDQWDAGPLLVKRVGQGKPSAALLETLDINSRDLFERKVYSTRRQDLLFRVGIELHFGLGQRSAKK